MNNLEEQLAKVIEKAIEVAEQTGQFVIEQAPDLLQEFYRWHLTKSIVFCIIAVILFWIGVFIFRKSGRKENTFKVYPEDSTIFMGKYYNSWDGFVLVSYIVTPALSIISFFLFFSSLYKIIFILTAPKLYLIEYFIK